MTLGDIYFYTWDDLVDKEIRRPLAQILAAFGTEVETANHTGWEESTVKRLLRLAPLQDMPGTPVFLLTPDELQHLSYKRVTVMTKRAIVTSLQKDFGSMRELARFLSKSDRYLGWLMAREELDS